MPIGTVVIGKTKVTIADLQRALAELPNAIRNVPLTEERSPSEMPILTGHRFL